MRKYRKYILTMLLLPLSVATARAYVAAHTTTHPIQIAAIGEYIAHNTIAMGQQAAASGEILGYQAAMDVFETKIATFERKYYQYLSEDTTGHNFLSYIRTGTSLYISAIETFRHLTEIKKAVGYNAQGILATVGMNDLYLQTAATFCKVYSLLQKCFNGGDWNMLTGAQRLELLWQLHDNMSELNEYLGRLAWNVAFYRMSDVWERVATSFCTYDKGHIAKEALKRWKRTAETAHALYGS